MHPMASLARSLLSKNLLRPRSSLIRRHIIRSHSTRRFVSRPNLKQTGNYIISALGFLGFTVSVYRTFKPDTNTDQVPHLEDEATLGEEHPLSEDDVTDQLSCEAYSVLPQVHYGVSRYDGARVAANSPCEDKFTHGSLLSPRKDGQRWLSWGVFDGHLGWQTAELLSKQLAPFVMDRLGVNLVSCDDHEEVAQEIAKAFANFDEGITKRALETAQKEVPLQEKLQALAPAYAGSCALLSLYDPPARTLYVACTGDSRAVLGEKQADGTWKATELSTDQDGYNEDEIRRINSEHPGESGIVKGGRVLGMMCSRAFGDARHKFPDDTLNEFSKRFQAPKSWSRSYPILTPPYLTAEPVVTTTKIDKFTTSFLILATDGLWLSINTDDAVRIVGKWLDDGLSSERQDSPHSASDFLANNMPWKYAEECSTFEDDNAAVHLIRNSLGGSNRELVAARLAYWRPRTIRDDVTVQVILFNKE